jgi:hypothetical protein
MSLLLVRTFFFPILHVYLSIASAGSQEMVLDCHVLDDPIMHVVLYFCVYSTVL